MHGDEPTCGLRGCLLPAGHAGGCDALRTPLDADELAVAAALIGEVLTHTETGQHRSVWLVHEDMQGSELQTHCGKWLPAWLDGPDGELNKSRWAIYTGQPPTCPVCAESWARLNGEPRPVCAEQSGEG